MSIDLKNYVCKQIEQSRDFYAKDLNALSDEALSQSAGGVARTPYSITYELITLNGRFTKRIMGEDPGSFDPTVWLTVPEELQNREAILKEFTDSTNRFLAAIEALPEGDINREIPTGNGSTSPFDLGLFCSYHIGYHDGQLNFIQTLQGDSEVHWL